VNLGKGRKSHKNGWQSGIATADSSKCGYSGIYLYSHALEPVVCSAYAAGGLAQTAPEGRVPLDSLPPLRRGTGAVTAVYPRCFVPPTGRRDEGAAASDLSENEYL